MSDVELPVYVAGPGRLGNPSRRSSSPGSHGRRFAAGDADHGADGDGQERRVSIPGPVREPDPGPRASTADSSHETSSRRASRCRSVRNWWNKGCRIRPLWSQAGLARTTIVLIRGVEVAIRVESSQGGFTFSGASLYDPRVMDPGPAFTTTTKMPRPNDLEAE